ncbi:biotin/lipoyl-containing protein [Ulvibacter litoralis]|uniref:biotin/lipoyl-containing protein n=1 Tax=Ulvibacter litoralis TaxID=227084 RepID=UPI000A81CE68|nr:acetyl-CoA carboxylase biotin carboxyl carrier protein subunit [Ulvibacter litoralis]GHC53770.1 hypothetical protein GCM10008083_17340 [Ulvibacter litoralis]
MEARYTLVVNDTHNFSVTKKETEQFDTVTSDKLVHTISDNHSLTATLEKSDFLKRTYTVKVNGNRYTVRIEDELDALIADMGLSLGEDLVANDITAPMPGLIIEVAVTEGQEVKKGDFLCVLEAMKMENALTSPRDGVIKSVTISTGQTVDKGDILIEFEA